MWDSPWELNEQGCEVDNCDGQDNQNRTHVLTNCTRKNQLD